MKDVLVQKNDSDALARSTTASRLGRHAVEFEFVWLRT